jgi:uncharacterized protein (DUF952 family)
MQPIYHLVPAGYYYTQPQHQPYQPESWAQEGFIHCTAGREKLVEIANIYFATLTDSLLVLEIDPQRLAAPLKFEPPIPPVEFASAPHRTSASDQDPLFPHIYGPLNREAVINIFTLQRNEVGQFIKLSQLN